MEAITWLFVVVIGVTNDFGRWKWAIFGLGLDFSHGSAWVAGVVEEWVCLGAR